MGEIGRIVGLGLALTVVMLFLRRQYPELAFELSMAYVVVVFLLLLGPLEQMVGLFRELGRRADLSGYYLDVVLRAVAVAYLATFGAQLSKDAGEGSIAALIELAGKVLILVLAIPLFTALLDTLLRLLPR